MWFARVTLITTTLAHCTTKLNKSVEVSIDLPDANGFYNVPGLVTVFFLTRSIAHML